MSNSTRDQFPPSFRWGVATSALQIEGATDADGRKPSIWDTFAAEAGRIRGGDSPAVACDHYHRWSEDLDLIARIGCTAYRFSVSWPRIIPDGRGAVNDAGLGFYDRLVDGLLERGIEPWLTLFHWDLPQSLESAGGWPNRDTAFAFADFADVVSRRLGDRVKRWITHNEPWCSTIKGYFEGDFAPGRQDLGAAIQACHHLLLSHGLALPVLRRNVADASCGITLSLHPVHPASGGADDLAAARRHDGLRNRWFLDPLYGRDYPADVLAELGPNAPAVAAGDMAAIAGKTDFLGVNYYFREIVAAAADATPVRSRVVEANAAEVTGSGWEVYPEGMTELLARVARDYAPGPIAVTENGASYPDEADTDGFCRDDRRALYISRHIAAMRAAMTQGVDLIGYFVWSLLDNFEWAEGYSKRFGLVHVDFATQKRTVKQSGRWFADFLGS
jgi:beta-glucosidase